MQLRLARHPLRLNAKHPIILEELLALESGGKQAAVSTMIDMLRDLHEQGRDSRFLTKLTVLPCGS